MKTVREIKTNSQRGDATLTLVIAIVVFSAIFLVGGIFPQFSDSTSDQKRIGVAKALDAGSVSGLSASSSTPNKSLQMRELKFDIITPTPTP